jgi:hypothetical protein
MVWKIPDSICKMAVSVEKFGRYAGGPGGDIRLYMVDDRLNEPFNFMQL